jgi:hypothetical protein
MKDACLILKRLSDLRSGNFDFAEFPQKRKKPLLSHILAAPMKETEQQLVRFYFIA